MFTGIIEDIGLIKEIKLSSIEKFFTFSVNKINSDEMSLGDSIAVNGVCLTVVSKGEGEFTVEASHETLSKTNLSKLEIGTKVNLELALKVGGRLGGHIVTGHIDGVGKVKSITKIGKSIEFWFSLSDELSRYFIKKGSVAVDGISLTVNEVVDNKFSVNIIPYTKDETTITLLKVGDFVNIECDIIGKYIEKFFSLKNGKSDKFAELLEKL